MPSWAGSQFGGDPQKRVSTETHVGFTLTIVGMKIPFSPFRYRYHSLRPLLVQPFFWLCFFAGPLVGLFRVDMIGQRLVFLGHSYPFEFQYLMWLPIVFYGGVVAIGVMSFVWGRLFCGWSCPHNTLTEWTRPIRALVGREAMPLWLKRFFNKQPTLRKSITFASPIIAIALTFTLSLILASYIVPMEWILKSYASGKPHIALVFGNGLFTLIGLFLLYTGHDFCRTCCPYGMGQSISAYQEGKWKPMEIHFSGSQTDDCKTCTGCQSACPVELDPRKPENLKVGQFYGCFNCGECVDACKTVHQRKGKGGLLSFELPWERAQRSKAGSA